MTQQQNYTINITEKKFNLTNDKKKVKNLDL